MKRDLSISFMSLSAFHLLFPRETPIFSAENTINIRYARDMYCTLKNLSKDNSYLSLMIMDYYY